MTIGTYNRVLYENSIDCIFESLDSDFLVYNLKCKSSNFNQQLRFVIFQSETFDSTDRATNKSYENSQFQYTNNRFVENWNDEFKTRAENEHWKTKDRRKQT